MKISKKFAELEKRGEKALILYIMCGDPSPEKTVELAEQVIKAGCDVLELGLPFSDPLADGPTIQVAGQRAIAAGMNTDRYFETCTKIGSGSSSVPKVCMTYYNLIYQYGLERFAARCAESGISGLIVPDLPPEEAKPLKNACGASHIDLIYIVSPQSSEQRLTQIKKARPKGFIYLQSVLGVTGARDSMKVELSKKITDIKRVFNLPVAVGFGVSKPEQVKELVAQGADGIIVGSALVKLAAEGGDVEAFVRSLKVACTK